MAGPLSIARKVTTDVEGVGGFQKIAAIDFGTTFCSLAYALSDKDQVANMPLNRVMERVPTAILLKKAAGNSFTVARFGDQAQDDITKLGDAIQNYLYFECFKMKLSREEDISRETAINSFNGGRYYLVEVIAFVLCHLKDQLINHLSVRGTQLLQEDFEWVITVPAIWKARGKQMMREAAYLAGLISGKRGISQFTPYGWKMECPTEESPHKLSLALEPECAAMYCHQLTNDLVAEYSDEPKEAETYMVCDLGGGTVDITTHIRHGEDNIEVIVTPLGNNSGGRNVNENFCILMGRIVKNPEFSLFEQKKGKESFHRAIVTQMVYRNFEDQKQTFGDDEKDDEYLRLILHHRFVEFYKKKIIQGIRDLHDRRITFNEDSHTLAIHYSKVKELFQPVMDGAIDCVMGALQRVEGKVDVIYLVGGFGGCRYTCNMLKPAIQAKYPRIPVVVPKFHTLAVSQGAVLYRRNPEKIRARRMDAYYGIESSTPFQEGVHNEHYAFYDPDDGHKRCHDVFLVFVVKGQKVAITDRFVETLIPHSKAQTKVAFRFFSTDSDNVQYIKDTTGKDNAQQIGSLKLDIPNPDNLPKCKRTMKVTMDFSSTEIKVQAQATYLPDSPPVKAVLDFLSSSL